MVEIERKRLIFKDIENCILGVKKKIEMESKELSPNIKYLKEEARKLAALEKVSKYIDSNEWLTRSDAKERINTVRALRYDYDKAAEELGMTYDAVKTFMRYCNKVVKSKVGESTLDLIMEGDIKVALVQFETLVGTLGVEEILIGEVTDKLPSAEFKPRTLKECKEEIEFLHDMSRSRMQERLEGLDREKLQFLMYIMTEDTPKYAKYKYDLVGLLTGQGKSIEEYMEQIDMEVNFRISEV